MKTAVAADRIAHWFSLHRGEMEELLERLVQTETPSASPEAQDRILDILCKALHPLGYRTVRVPGKMTGGYLYAGPSRNRNCHYTQLLLGHCDTVWPVGTLKKMKYTADEKTIRGPGVFDMKAGLTQMIFALRAVEELNLDPFVVPLVLINADEEIGSRESGHAIRRLARLSNRALVLEPPLGLDGKLKTARKGVGRFTIHVTGKASHAGLDPEKGASAIVELSRQVQRLFDMNDHKRGITVNVGQIEGGMSPNVIAPESKAVVDVRVLTDEDAKMITRKIHGLQSVDPNARLRIEGGIKRPPLERTDRNRKLWEMAKTEGRKLGLDLEEGTAGGGSDGNTTSRFCATLDGLGAVGDGAHARHEFIYRESLVERGSLLTLLINLPPV